MVRGVRALLVGAACAAGAALAQSSSSASSSSVASSDSSSTASVLQPTVTVGSLTLQGTRTSLPGATQAVNKYLGVPFAQSPPERFGPPQPVDDSTSSTLEVTQWKPACIQMFPSPAANRLFTMSVFNQPTPAESEDCLYLNVYSPATPSSPASGRAVLFWIFGGAFTFGHAGQPLYDGSAFAAYQDVIVVAANYRTNVFGFPTSPQLNATQRNVGLMDQRLALQWVQDNIATFGGDPKQVTIIGESAGGSSVDILLTSYTTDTAPFRGAILESGQFSFQPQNYTNNATGWSGLVSGVKCSGDSDELACVRRASADDIRTVIQDNTVRFYPTPDNVTLSLDPARARLAGNFARVPVLGGTNANEGRVYTVGMSDVAAFVQKYFGRVPGLGDAVSSLYQTLVPGGAYERVAQIYTDFGFLCPQSLWANASVAQGVPTWLYYYNSSFPNTAFLNPSGSSGVWHSSEISTVFQSYPGGPINPNPLLPYGLLQYQLPATDEQRQLSAFMNKAWADFAKNPSQGPGWAALGDGNMMAVLGEGSDGNTGAKEVPQEALHSQCPLFTPVYEAYSPNAQAGLPGGNDATGTDPNTPGGNSNGGGDGGSAAARFADPTISMAGALVAALCSIVVTVVLPLGLKI